MLFLMKIVYNIVNVNTISSTAENSVKTRILFARNIQQSHSYHYPGLSDMHPKRYTFWVHNNFGMNFYNNQKTNIKNLIKY